MKQIIFKPRWELKTGCNNYLPLKKLQKKDLTQFEPVFPRSLLSPTTNCDTKPPIGGEEIFRGVLKE